MGVPIVTVGTRYRHLNDSKWFCSFLQRFRPRMRESVQNFTGSSLHWACSALELGVYSSIYLNLCQQSLLSDLLNQRKSTPKHFLEGVRLSFRLFCGKQTNYYAIDCPYQSNKPNESREVSLLHPILFLPREMIPTIFSSNVYSRDFLRQKYVSSY